MSAAVGAMNLLELLEKHREKFYFGYTQWWIGEAFSRVLPSDPLPAFPRKFTKRGSIPKGTAEQYPRAVDLLTHYVQRPDAAIWQEGRMWCSDRDAVGRRVYLLHHNGLMEIHRWDEPDMGWGLVA
jgi:hypothetical protein